MKLKKYKKTKLSTYISINLSIIIFSFICATLLIAILSQRSHQILLPYAKLQLEKAISFVINHATDNIDASKELYSLDITNNEIKMLNYNTVEVVKLLDQITFNIEDDLRAIETGHSRFPEFANGFYGEIPFGLIFDNVFFNNLGPTIKLKFKFLGSIVSEVTTEVKPYGINNALLELHVSITVDGQILIPFVSEPVSINNTIPISINVVQGTVPQGYITTYK